MKFSVLILAILKKMTRFCTYKYGGCSSVVEHQIVALRVVGSIPITRPILYTVAVISKKQDFLPDKRFFGTKLGIFSFIHLKVKLYVL